VVRANQRRGGRRGVTVALGAVVVVLLVVVVAWVVWPRQEVLLVGDSILRQTGPSLDDELGRDDVRNAAVNGSGLITPAVYDWQSAVPELLEGDPDVVVVLFVGNHTDVDVPLDPDGDAIEKGSPEFFDAWGAAAEQLAATLVDAGVEIRWVLPPPMLAPDNQAIADGLTAEFEAVAARHPEVVLVDADRALAGDDGSFLAQVEDEDGEVVPLRAGDGVHLDDEGARRLAALIAESL
jgi:hypothetical protein